MPRGHTQRKRGRGHLQGERPELLSFRAHQHHVIEAPADHIGAATHHRLQRFCAAGEVHDLNLQAFVGEISQALGEREGEVIKRGFAADRDGHLRFFQRRGRGLQSGSQPACQCDQAGNDSRVCFHVSSRRLVFLSTSAARRRTTAPGRVQSAPFRAAYSTRPVSNCEPGTNPTSTKCRVNAKDAVMFFCLSSAHVRIRCFPPPFCSSFP